MDEPEWVDAFQGHSVADEVWLRRQMQNGDVPRLEPKLELVPQEDSWAPRNLAELEDRPPVEPTLGGLSLCYPGKRHVFSGPQESAKTLAAYVLGLQVVRAGSTVVLIDFEMGPWDAKARLRELGATQDELASVLYIEPAVRATESAIGAIVQLAPALVIVDAAAGAYDLQELDDNKRSDVERFTRFYVNGFWKAGIATIVLDHVTKNAETRGNYAIGSERKVGGADVHLGFTVITPIKRGTHGRYQITTHKDRGGFHKRGRLATFELTSDPCTHHFTWSFVPAQETDEEHPFRPTGLMEKASIYIEGCMESPSENAIVSTILGKSTDHKRLAIERLVIEGYVNRYDGPRRSKLHESIRPFREASDDFASTSPDFASESAETTSPLRLSPLGGGEVGDVRGESGEVTSPNLLDDDDGIPF